MEQDRKILEDELSMFAPVLEFTNKYPNTRIIIESSPKLHIWLHVNKGEISQEEANACKIITTYDLNHGRQNT